MTIAYVCADPGVPAFGSKGCSVHVQGMLRAFLTLGHEVTLLATRAGGPVPGPLQSVAQVALPRLRFADPTVRELAAMAANMDLRDALGRLEDVELVYERHSLWSHAGMEWARDAGVPAVLEVNAPLIDEQAEHRTLVHRAEAETTTRRALAAATAVIAVSDGIADWLAGFPEAAGAVHVVGNGVDPDRFPPREASPRPFTVGFVGTLKPWHGLDVLADAFALLRERVPDARLRIVGDGPGRAPLQRALADRGAHLSADFVGAVAPEHVADELAAMDVAVAPYPDLPSFYFSPLKILDAMAAGLPVVCSRVGALDALVAHEVTGLLCAPGDPRALSAALERLEGDAALRGRLGAAGRQHVLTARTWDRVAERVLALARVAA